MPDTIRAIGEEIDKIEDRIRALKGEVPNSDRERKIKEATLSLLEGVLSDLRKQQQKLKNSRDKEGAHTD